MSPEEAHFQEMVSRWARAQVAKVPPIYAPLADVKRWHMERVLDYTDGNKTRAATMLGVSKMTLHRAGVA